MYVSRLRIRLMHKAVIIGPDHELTPDIVVEVAFNSETQVELSGLAKERIARAREAVEKILDEGKVVYGVTTGFGSFKDKAISKEQLEELQNNLIRSHASGVGEPLSKEIVRAILVVRLNSFVQGHSGVRLELAEFLVGLINNNVLPYVPSQGSVGSSGDLAPLSHMGLLVLGEGKAWYEGELMSGAEALEKAGMKPVGFRAKEGLAWNNGTSVMTGIGSVTYNKAKRLVDNADVACALSLEALLGISSAFDERIHLLRKHPGQIKSAKNIREAFQGSGLIDSDPKRIQDSYSLRCSPQVHGAVRDALEYVEGVLIRELNSVNDNPIIFPEDDEVISGGNFHGEPVAIAMDTMAIAVSELANISERRTAKLVDPATNHGLPAFLISEGKGGLNSGFMIPQYVAAALVSENKILAHPASVDSIPTSANQEDHVSMGTIGARKAAQVVDNTNNVIAIEVLSAAQGIDFREPSKLGKVTSQAYRKIRDRVEALEEDRVMSDDIDKVSDLIASDNLLI